MLAGSSGVGSGGGEEGAVREHLVEAPPMGSVMLRGGGGAQRECAVQPVLVQQEPCA